MPSTCRSVPGAALHRQPRRLVQHDDLVVLVYDQAADLLGVAVRHGRDLARLGRRRGGDAGRQADGLAGLDPVLALGALAVDADLAGAQKLLQGAVAQLGEMALEPAIEPQAGLVVGDGSGLDLGARRSWPLTCLPRHTGEVARRAGGGKPQRRYLKDDDHDLKCADGLAGAFPLRPLRGHLPRMTGEEGVCKQGPWNRWRSTR